MYRLTLSLGHEDLRQDERVMQLFGLVNGLLAQNHEIAKSHLSIERYHFIPLTITDQFTH